MIWCNLQQGIWLNVLYGSFKYLLKFTLAKNLQQVKIKNNVDYSSCLQGNIKSQQKQKKKTYAPRNSELY